MNLKELMSTKPNDLAKMQFKELKAHVLKVLSKVTTEIKNDNLEIIESLTFHSPAGDGYGEDNHCIDFDYGDGNCDILYVVDILKQLKSQF